ncbi:MAG TPA: ATP-NAD kinase family protein [Methanoregula sp.]|nr:ATP-NAD kinase family protein [Methanoregula sp.]
MRRIGFLINPIAGLGGTVGLKGTDGSEEEARKRGAVPHAQDRAEITLGVLKNISDTCFLTCSGEMGERALLKCGGIPFRVVYSAPKKSSEQDTKNAVRAFLDEGVDLILFCGGDGTARDVYTVAGRDIPILGIPAGVKMYSAVFAIDPAAAGVLLSGPYDLRDAEVMDVNEEAYRNGVLETHLYGIARVPVRPGLVQAAKQVFEEASEERAKTEIARFIGEVMIPDTLYILGAGTTTEAIAQRLNVNKTLLGVDVILNGHLVASDVDEKTLLRLIDGHRDVRIILSPIGAQGFILGRGNQQISAAVVKKAGPENLIVVATPHKLRETPALYVDSGDRDLDAVFGKSIQVISGYRIAQRKKIGYPGTENSIPL